LIANLEDARFYIRSYSLEALSAMGPGARSALVPAAALLTDPHPAVRSNAVRTLLTLGPDTTVLRQLLEALPTGEMPFQANLIRAIGMIGPKAQEAAPVLIALAGSDIVRLNRDMALWSLEQILSPDPALIPSLIALLEVDHPAAIRTAASLLKTIGPPAMEAVPALRMAAEQEKKYVMGFAADALQSIEGEPAP
jgi:HEAT repeat protein